MGVEVVPFVDGFVDRAADLLAAVHAPSAGEGVSAVDLADPGVTRELLGGWRPVGPAVAALRGGELAGFMAATVAKVPGSPLGRVRMQHHAAAPDGRRAIYRHLYQALSRDLAAIGCFEHAVVVCAGHRDVLACLVELGFGIDQIKGFRTLTPPAGRLGEARRREVRLRLACPEDVAELLRLVVELQWFHAEAPMLRPALTDLYAIKDDLDAAIAAERRLVLVAEVRGRFTGVMVADPDSRRPGAVSIGIAVVSASSRAEGVGTALLSGVVEWAATHGFSACGAEWSSANLVSDAFWRGHGFAPARCTLTRRVDQRVAWADSQVNYRPFFPQ